MKQIKKWATSSGIFLPQTTASIWVECIKLNMFNYQDNWYIKPETKLSKEDEIRLDFQSKVLPLFEEILKFENKDISYTLLYISKTMPIKQYTKQYHFDNETDFDILIIDARINNEVVEGMIKRQVTDMGDISNVETLEKALEAMPYNFKGIVIHNSKLNQDIFYYGKNFLSAKSIIEEFNEEAVYDLYKHGELTNFLVDYTEYRMKAKSFIDRKIKSTINWLQVAFENKLVLSSDNEDIQKIFDTSDIATFIKYEWQNVSYDTFKILIDEILSYVEATETV